MVGENVDNFFEQPGSGSDNIAKMGGTFEVDVISELTSGTGVTADGVLLKDGEITTTVGKTDFQQFYGINDVVVSTVGTFAKTRDSKGLYVLRKSAADDTSTIGVDILPLIRTTALKGASLTSISYIFANATADLDAHTVTLSRITYADSTTEVVTDVPVTGTAGVGQDADPQVDVFTIDAASFEITSLSKLVFEATVNAATTSVYDFIGIVGNYTRLDN